MRKQKFTLTERRFGELRKTLEQRKTNRYEEGNIEAAYDVLVNRLPIRVASERLERKPDTVRRVVRELWCIAHGLTKWDLYLHRIPPRLAERTGITKIRRKNRPHPPEQRCLYRTTRARSGGPGWQLLIQRQIDRKLVHVAAFFADSAYPGEAGALKAAQSRRDEVERLLPPRNAQTKPSLFSQSFASTSPPGPREAGAETSRQCNAVIQTGRNTKTNRAYGNVGMVEDSLETE